MELNSGYNIIYVKLRKDANDKYLLENQEIYQKFRFNNDFDKLNSDKYIHKILTENYSAQDNYNFIKFNNTDDYVNQLIATTELDELKIYMKEPWLPFSLKDQDEMIKQLNN